METRRGGVNNENEPELTYPYEDVDPLNPPPPTSELEPEDVIVVENMIEHEDETIPASVHEVGELYTAHFLREDSDGLLPGLMRRDINSLFGQMASLSRRLCGRKTAHALVEKKGKAKDDVHLRKTLGNISELHSKWGLHHTHMVLDAQSEAEIILSQGLPSYFNILIKQTLLREIWDNVEMLMQLAGLYSKGWKNYLMSSNDFVCHRMRTNYDYFVRFHKLVNDMKITQLELFPSLQSEHHSLSTTFVLTRVK
ncbi:hypothetical protein Tco_0442127 [Tanacetum coccineum]